MPEGQKHKEQKTKNNLMLALILGLVAILFFVAYIKVGVNL